MATLLYNRSCYTLLESTLRISQLVNFAKNNNYSSIAICDHNVMHGYMLFKKTCEHNLIKPIFGLEVDVMVNDDICSFLLYAKNDKGYSALVKCSTELLLFNKPLTLEKLTAYAKQCIVIIPVEHGPLERAINNDDFDSVKLQLQQYQQLFASLYVGYESPYSNYLKAKNATLLTICNLLNIEMVSLSLALYEKEENHESYKVLLSLKQTKLLSDPNLRFQMNRHLLKPNEFALFPDSAVKNTDVIALQCRVDFRHQKATMPKYKCPEGVDSNTYLRLLCAKGLEKRFEGRLVPTEYHRRINYELDVITTMGFADYFLIVWDFVLFARKAGIYVGPGRGSAAGSMVSYCLGITHLDPIKYHLLFERFLNPERISMPDIDTDFPDDKRDIVIAYVKEKYGTDHIGHIVTFGTMAAKQAIRDVGRVLALPVKDIDLIAKAIPNVLKITLRDAYETNKRFKQIIQSDERFMRLYQLASEIEGLPRHLSTHAAGIVMSESDLQEIIPLVRLEENTIATQYSMEYLEELGLLKMDFLGLRNLTIIDEIVSDINMNNSLDIMHIPLDDAKTFKLIQDVDTVGIFQLESDGMKALLKKIHPTVFEDVATTIALFRPGPMDNIPEYLRRKNNPSLVNYPHQDVKWILEDTYGIMVFQEQIMQVSQVMAGFTLGKADILRSAMSKKKESELIRLEKDFIAGCLENGYSKQTATTVYEFILKFASYGFNRAHSVAYALVSYQLAYLKANYPLYFYRSLLNSVIGSETKTNEYIVECRRKGINVLPPSVNNSSDNYHIEDGGIRFPILGIKSVGVIACEQLLKERNSNGPYSDYYDFIVRISGYKISKAVVENLINAGALDEFGLSRKTMKLSLNNLVKYADLVRYDNSEQIVIDLDMVSKPVLVVGKDIPLEKAELEKNVLGFYFSKHPIERIKELQPYPVISLQNAIAKRGEIRVFVQISRTKQHRTKNGELMCFVSASDESADYDFVVMPRLYMQHQSELVKGNYMYFEGDIDERDSCLVKKMVKYTISES